MFAIQNLVSLDEIPTQLLMWKQLGTRQQRQPSHHSALRWRLICSSDLFDIDNTRDTVVPCSCSAVRVLLINLIVWWWWRWTGLNERRILYTVKNSVLLQRFTARILYTVKNSGSKTLLSSPRLNASANKLPTGPVPCTDALWRDQSLFDKIAVLVSSHTIWYNLHRPLPMHRVTVTGTKHVVPTVTFATVSDDQ